MQRLLKIKEETFSGSFNRQPFVIHHQLVGHPLFTLPRLIELSKALPEESVKYNSGNVPVTQSMYSGPRTGLSIQETIRRIEECGSWMVLKNVERDPAYRDLLDRCLDEIQPLCEPLDPGMRQREGFIFISSPSSVTPFHIDPEYNFLLQIRGKKVVNIFDASDRSILPEQELEGFYSGSDFQIVFKDGYQQKASVFELSPGMGLHFPVTAPHWIKNGEQCSISFSITFRTLSSERNSVIYQFNDRLRRIGLAPTPVGRSALRDSAKFYAGRVLRRAKRLLAGPSQAQSAKYAREGGAGKPG